MSFYTEFVIIHERKVNKVSNNKLGFKNKSIRNNNKSYSNYHGDNETQHCRSKDF